MQYKGVFKFRGGSRTAATSKIERFVIIVNGSILNVAAVLDTPLKLHILIHENPYR